MSTKTTLVHEKRIKKMLVRLTKKLQQDYDVISLGFGDKLRITYPRLWEQVKENWEEVFHKIPVRYNVKVTIRDYER